MRNKLILKDMAIVLGIGFKNMTIYRAELIHLRSDGKTDKEIADLISKRSEIEITQDAVNKWYTRESQPKACVIELLEEWYFKRERNVIERMRNPLLLQ